MQQAISSAGTDRVMLVRNLEAYLNKYPEAQNRSQIYRALVEACIQLRDNTRAADYAERIVALNPSDISITLLAIQLLQRQNDEPGLRRAVSYATRVLDYVNRTSPSERSPRISETQWQLEKKSDQASTLFMRGDIFMKLKDFAAAQQDFQAGYQILPSAGAAERLGEIAELKKDWNSAVTEYARAFALAEGKNGSVSRKEIRQKLGNVWRMAHGSEDGLGEYLLRTFDEVSQSFEQRETEKKCRRSRSLRISSFERRRKAPRSPCATSKGKVLVLNFWATWCGPCHALEPQFARVAMEFQGAPDVLFLAANCDEDETLVAPYLEENKPHTAVVFCGRPRPPLCHQLLPNCSRYRWHREDCLSLRRFRPGHVRTGTGGRSPPRHVSPEPKAVVLVSGRKLGAVSIDDVDEVGHFRHVFPDKSDRVGIHALHGTQVAQHLGRRVVFETDFQGHRCFDNVGLEITEALERGLHASGNSLAGCFRSDRLRGMKTKAPLGLSRLDLSQPRL